MVDGEHSWLARGFAYQGIRPSILQRDIADQDVLWLLDRVISSFSSTRPGVGLPLGNLTSQLLVNVYMNEFDQFVKRGLGVGYYVRYADDFVLLSDDRMHLEELLPRISEFLRRALLLELHPNKVFLLSLASGVDFLGWVHFPDHRVLRTATRKRMERRVVGASPAAVQSYLGLLGHGNANTLRRSMEASFLDSRLRGNDRGNENPSH